MNKSRLSMPKLSTAVLALLTLPAGWVLWAQTPPDTDPPVIRVVESGTDLTDGRLFNRAATPVLQVTDASAVTVDATLDGADFTSGTVVSGEGTHLLSVTVTDAAGNAASLVVGFEIDTTPPAFGAVSPAHDSVLPDAQVTLQGQVAGASAVTVEGQPATLAGQDFTAGPYSLSEGARTWTIVARDPAGNTAQRTHRITRDSQAPTVAISQPAAGAVLKEASVDVVGSAQDPRLTIVTVNGTAATLTGSIWVARQVPLAEGGNSLVARAEDRAGNATEVTRAIVRDSQAPDLAITDPAPGTVVPGASITLRGTASDPHLDRVEVNGVRASLTGTAWSLAMNLTDGTNDFTVRAFDRVNNATEAAVSVTRDSDAPAVRITQPADGARLSAQTVTVSGTVDDEPGLTVTVNGVTATVTGGTFSASGISLVEGENTLTARARDSVGNQGTHTRVLIRDTVAPRLLSADPASGALALPIDAVFRLTFSEDLADLAAGSLRLETGTGQSLGTAISRVGSVVTVRSIDPLPSSTQIRLVLTEGVKDLAGNALTPPPALAFFTVDTTAPGSPIFDPAPPARVCAPSLTLSGTAEAGAVLRVVGGAAATEARADETGHFSLSVQLSPGGLNRLRVTATDGGGNDSPEAIAQVVHDCQAPRVVSAERQGDLFNITFSEPVQAASLNGAVKLTGSSGAVAGAASLSANGLTATFDPDGALPAGALRLEVTIAVRDLAGNAMAYPWSQVFGAQGGNGFLLGTVIDNATGRPLAGARILVYATNGTPLAEPLPEQVTGEDGRFRLPVPAGAHDLTIVRPGYTPSFRIATTGAGQGTDVFDPRLTPAAETQTLGAAGGNVSGGGTGDDPLLTLPSGALAASVAVAVTRLDEQGLPALLPYGWSPRGAAWLELGGAALGAESTLSLPVDAPNGTTLTLVHLDLASLQWRVLGSDQVTGGRVEITLPAAAAGLTDGGYAAVEGDTGALAPPAPVAGAVLGASTRPAGDEPTGATLTFNPQVVLPSQSSLATAVYTLSQPAASGLPLTLLIEEKLTLLDNSVRRQTPYQADLILYHAPNGTPRSRFQLRPSSSAQALPLKLGAEDVTLRTYGGEAVSGNVVGPEGGTVSGAEGDRIDLPAGAVTELTAIVVTRKAAADLGGLAVPTGTELAGVVDLDLGGRRLLVPGALSLALSPAPAMGEKGLLLHVIEPESGRAFRAVAALQATSSGWTTVAIDTQDLAWPGVREEGLYAFVRLTAGFGYLRGTVSDVGGVPLSGAVVRSNSVTWLQLSNANGTYVLPVPVGTVTATAENRATGNLGTGQAEIAAADTRVDLNITLQPVGPRVIQVTPADGTVDVLQGIQPTIRFSEPVAPASVNGAIQLLSEGLPVAIDLEVNGSLVRVKPRSALLPLTQHELRVTSGVQDLQGNFLESPVASHFTTLRVLLTNDVDLSRVFLVEPDANGQARVLGRPGAVPANALVFIENRSALVNTPSVHAGQNGGFDVNVEAALSHTLILHVLIPGSNEIVSKLTPFRTPDLKGAYLDDKAVTFTTGDGVKVVVPEGAFTGPTVVRLATKPVAEASLPAPEDLTPIFAFTLDFGGAEAFKPLQISLPFPAGAATAVDGDYLLNRRVEALGQGYWMLHDLMRLDTARGVLTTEEVTGTTANAVAQVASLSLGVLADLGPTPLTAPVSQERRKRYMPGAILPGEYEVVAPQVPLGWPVLPSFSFDGYVAVFNTGLEGMATVINAKIDSLLGRIGVLIPTRLGRAFTLTGRDISTGFKVFEATFDPPLLPDLQFLRPDIYGDNTPPFPVSGSPIRFYVIDGGQEGDLDLDLRIKLHIQDGTLTVTGEPQAAQPGVALRFLGLDDSVTAEAVAGADGSFELSKPIDRGHRYLLVVSARIGSQEDLYVSFNEALGDFTGIELQYKGSTLVPDIGQRGARWNLRVGLPSGWNAGETYVLRLSPALADAQGNAWNKDLKIPFAIAKSDNLGNYSLNRVRDIAALGSLLFVAADEEGLVVLDASDPKNIKNYLPGNVKFPFPLGDRVSGVAIDPHGRVLVAGGGIRGFGQLKIFDPLELNPQDFEGPEIDPQALLRPFKGNTLLSDKLGAAGGSGLPAGTPSKVTVLSSDDTYEWKVSDGPSAGAALLQVSPAQIPQDGSEFTLTVTGVAPAGHPVSLFDLTLGRWTRVDAPTLGRFEISLRVFPHDRVRLVINKKTLAYVMVQGVGIEVVDVDEFYNEDRQEQPSNILSDVRGVYTGADDPDLRVCGEQVADLSTALLDFDALFQEEDPSAPGLAPNAIPLHPISLFALLGQRGFVILESSVLTPGNVSYLNDECANINGDANVAALKLLQGYRFDFNNNGQLDDEQDRDYALVAHRRAGVLLYDVTNREEIRLVGNIRLPGQAANLGVDRNHRRLFVAAASGGLYIVDLNSVPSTVLVDRNRDGQDDRILETIRLDGNTNSVVRFLPELGLAFSGGARLGTVGGGVTALAVDRPTVRAVARIDQGAGKGRFREVVRLAPFGVPTGKENGRPDAPDLPGLIYLVAELPGSLGPEIRLDVEGIASSGQVMRELGDPSTMPNLPRVSNTGPENGLKLKRVSEKPWEDGYHRYVSAPVAVLADIRASRYYERNAEENKAGHCDRCEQKLLDPEVPEGVEGHEVNVPADTVEILSGDFIDIRIPAVLRPRLEELYGQSRLQTTLLRMQSVRWEMAPSPRQEARLNAGQGEAAPGTLLSSGEMTAMATDLVVKGRGFDFAFTRFYRNQTVGNGPLGPGWDHNYNERLRELPNGDVEYFDGHGRKEVFKRDEGIYTAPAGLFVGLDGGNGDLGRLSTGWILIDAHQGKKKFDRFGKLVSVADATKDSADTGNEMRFYYDLASRLVRIEDTLKRNIRFSYDADGRLKEISDFDGRKVKYEYDSTGRLSTVTSPAITTGLSKFPNGLVTRYQYRNFTGNLTQRLVQRDNLAILTDPKEQPWLELLYDDVDGDGRIEEVTSQKWGNDTVLLAYTFGEDIRTVVTDRRGNNTTYRFDAEGRTTRIVDATNQETTYEYWPQGQLRLVTSPSGRKTRYVFQEGLHRSGGNLLKTIFEPNIKGPNGSSAQLIRSVEYDPNTNEPISVTEPWGEVTHITLDRAGRPRKIDQAVGTPGAATTLMTYNKYGQTETVTSPTGELTKFTYFPEGASKGYLSQVDNDGLVTRFETDARGNVTAMVDPNQVRHEQDWNEVDWLVEKREAVSAVHSTPLNYKTSYLYDANGNRIEEKMPFGDGNEVTSDRYTYGLLNELKSVTREVMPGGPSVQETRGYDKNLNLTSITEPEGRITEFTYDPRNLLKTVTQAAQSPIAETETYTYDEDGLRVTTTDHREKMTKTLRDGYGRVGSIVDPYGFDTRIFYNNGGLQTDVVTYDINAKILAKNGFEYDQRNRLKTEKVWAYSLAASAEPAQLPEGSQVLETKYEYDAGSRLKKVTDPRGAETTYAYDHAGRLKEATDAEGNRIHLTLDNNGNATLTQHFLTGPGGGPSTINEIASYDALNRQTSGTDGLGNKTEYRYDARGNLSLVLEPGNIPTEWRYDALDRLTSETRPNGIAVSYGYDGASRLRSLTDAAGQQTSYDYDLLDRLTKTTYADGKVVRHEFDRQANTRTITDPRGFKVEETFDNLNRLTRREVKPQEGNTISGPLVEEYGYDGLSRLVSARSGAVTVQRGLDSMARILKETVGGDVVEYEYDPSSNPKVLNYPSGRSLVRRFDGLNRPSVIGGLAPGAADAWYGYRGSDSLGTSGLRNGIAGSYDYDAAGRPTGITFSDAAGKTPFQETLQWSPRSLLLSESRSDQNGAGFRYALDDAGRLLSATRVATPTQEGAESNPALRRAFASLPSRFEYEFDATENLLSRTASQECEGTKIDLPLDESGRNRPASAGNSTLAYDAAGNLIQKGNVHFEYDFRNRLTRVTNPQGEVARYSYDAFDRRVSKVVGGRTYETVWDGMRPIEEWENLGEAGRRLVSRRTYGAGLDEIVLLETDLDGDGVPESKATPIYDQVGNVVALTRPNGSIIERYLYSPFGAMWALSDEIPPVIEQVRIKSGEIWIEMSEEVSRERLQAAAAAGGIKLVNLSKENQEIQIAVSQPVKAGRQANRRLVIALNDPVPPEAGNSLELRIADQILVDLFGHSAPARTFPISWAPGDRVLLDSTPPSVAQVCLAGQTLKVLFSEEVDTARAATVIRVDNAAADWTLSQDRYGLSTGLSQGAHTLHIGTAELDLQGLGLAEPFDRSFTVAGGNAMKAIFEAPDPRVSPVPTSDNPFGFHGLPRDPETGLIYARHRYYDPELGRFITTDPLGYVDGPNLYQFALNNPVDHSDPTGMIADTVWDGISLGVGLYSLNHNLEEGNFGAAALDAFGIVVDGVAAAVPFIPGGAGAAIQASRVPRAVKQFQLVNQAIDVSQGTAASIEAFQEGRYGWGTFYGGMAALGAHGGLVRNPYQFKAEGLGANLGNVRIVEKNIAQKSEDVVVLYHGTSSNRAAKIVGNARYPQQGFKLSRFRRVYFAEERATAEYFAFEQLAHISPITPKSLSLIEFRIPRRLAGELGLLKSRVIGEDAGLPFPDIAGGSGFERILFSEHLDAFNGALQSGIIQTRRLRIRL